MSNYLRMVLIPLVVLIAVFLIITGIGSLLLTVGNIAAVPVALGIATAVMAICTFLATRSYESGR